MESKIIRKHTITALALLLLLLMIAVAYSNALSVLPVLDDFHTFVQRPDLFSGQLSVQRLIQLSSTIFGWNRWIPLVTFAIDFWVGKGDLIWFHVTNIIIHCLVMFSIFFLIFQLLRASEAGAGFTAGVSTVYCAIWIAGVWALHPVQTNAVTYLVQRMASIQTLFFTLSMGFYVKARRDQRVGASPLKVNCLFLLSVLFACCAFLSKQNAAMLPFMILAAEWWFFQPDLFLHLWSRSRVSSRTAQFLCVFGMTAVVCRAVTFLHSIATSGYDVRYFTLSERLLTETRVVVWYMSLLLWPDPSRMSIEHDIDVSTSICHPPTTLLAMLMLGFLVWPIFRYRKRSPFLTYAGLWFFANLVIESTIVPLELMFEHRLYLPSIGFFAFVIIGILKFVQNAWPRKSALPEHTVISWCCFAIIVSCLCITTFVRNIAWQNPLSIYADAALKAPQNPRARANLAVAYCHAGHYESAIKEAEITIGLGKPRYEQYHLAANVIVRSLLEQGNIHEAIKRGEQLYTQRPENSESSSLYSVCDSIAMGYTETAEIEKAYFWSMEAFKHAQFHNNRSLALHEFEGVQADILKLAKQKQIDLDHDGNPDPGELHPSAWIAREYLGLGDSGNARRMVSQALLEDPENVGNQRIQELVSMYEASNNFQQGRWRFTAKYIQNPLETFNGCMLTAFYIFRHNLPGFLVKIGELCLDHALTLHPDDAGALLLKGWYYFNRDRVIEAIECARKAVEMDPQYARAWIGLGFFLAKAQETEAALAAFERTLELYPGNPKRASIMEIISDLRKRKAG